MNNNTRMQIEQSVHYLENMGFFKDGFSFNKFHDFFLEEYFDEFFDRHPNPIDRGELDDILLAQDRNRVSTVGDEITNRNDAEERYLNRIQHWGSISRGIFDPKNISFRWIQFHEVFEIRFEFDAHNVVIISDSVGHVDPTILDEINKLLRDTDIYLYTCNAQNMAASVIALTQDEKKKLESERGWSLFCYQADLLKGEAG